MGIAALAGIITWVLTTLLTVSGVGAAFILIPIFIALGIDVHVAMSTALLLNSIAMTCASYRFIRNRLVMWKVALPILTVATVLSPVGAYVSRGLDQQLLMWLFVGFLLFAAGMMLFYESERTEAEGSRTGQLVYGLSVGALAGFLGGLLGVGGGNFIVPVLVWLGFNPKKAAATTSFIVIFSSFSGFLGHASFGHIEVPLLGFTALGSALGAVTGAWLVTEKLKGKQVKRVIGFVLLGIALKMIWNLLA
ncbi:MAG: sulfite exporter TauE/SafE family protein [Thermodesulfobacteriota bacterium]|nr:sulfite exporter TauE/SafE family protein [Thermodesulfobacteriota bacterium]